MIVLSSKGILGEPLRKSSTDTAGGADPPSCLAFSKLASPALGAFRIQSLGRRLRRRTLGVSSEPHNAQRQCHKQGHSNVPVVDSERSQLFSILQSSGVSERLLGPKRCISQIAPTSGISSISYYTAISIAIVGTCESQKSPWNANAPSMILRPRINPVSLHITHRFGRTFLQCER